MFYTLQFASQSQGIQSQREAGILENYLTGVIFVWDILRRIVSFSLMLFVYPYLPTNSFHIRTVTEKNAYLKNVLKLVSFMKLYFIIPSKSSGVLRDALR